MTFRAWFGFVLLLLTPLALLAQEKSPKETSEKNAVGDKESESPQSKPEVKVKFKPLTDEQLEKLLGKRMGGRLGRSFAQFGNLFMAMSSIHLGTSVGLVPLTKDVAKTELQPVFPDDYEPTLRELLDAIALQAKCKWRFDPSAKHIKSEVDAETTIRNIAIFEFEKADREKPFEITMAEGWKATDQGHWVMYSPPDFPIGMDIYEIGNYSKDDGPVDQAFMEKIRLANSLTWAKRVSPMAAEADLKSAKVGDFDALYFEAMIPSKLKKEIRWRQRIFMDGSKCYFIVSTILPELDDKIFPDVEKMIASFKVKDLKAEVEKPKTQETKE